MSRQWHDPPELDAWDWLAIGFVYAIGTLLVPAGWLRRLWEGR